MKKEEALRLFSEIVKMADAIAETGTGTSFERNHTAEIGEKILALALGELLMNDYPCREDRKGVRIKVNGKTYRLYDWRLRECLTEEEYAIMTGDEKEEEAPKKGMKSEETAQVSPQNAPKKDTQSEMDKQEDSSQKPSKKRKNKAKTQHPEVAKEEERPAPEPAESFVSSIPAPTPEDDVMDDYDGEFDFGADDGLEEVEDTDDMIKDVENMIAESKGLAKEVEEKLAALPEEKNAETEQVKEEPPVKEPAPQAEEGQKAEGKERQEETQAVQTTETPSKEETSAEYLRRLDPCTYPDIITEDERMYAISTVELRPSTMESSVPAPLAAMVVSSPLYQKPEGGYGGMIYCISTTDKDFKTGMILEAGKWDQVQVGDIVVEMRSGTDPENHEFRMEFRIDEQSRRKRWRMRVNSDYFGTLGHAFLKDDEEQMHVHVLPAESHNSTNTDEANIVFGVINDDGTFFTGSSYGDSTITLDDVRYQVSGKWINDDDRVTRFYVGIIPEDPYVEAEEH